MTLGELLATLSFVVLGLFLSYRQHLRFERDILWGAGRAFAQLLAMGYIIQVLFDARSWVLIAGVLLFMALVASQNVYRRGGALRGAFWWVFGTLALTETAGMGLLLLLHIVPAQARFVIPLSGMVIGNAMVAVGLTLHRLREEVELRQAEIRTALALGATGYQAIQGALRAAIRSGAMPSIDGMKTMGIVQLPGMMTGLIVAGVNPLQAVRYQVMVLFMLLFSVLQATVTVGLFAYRFYFTAAHQLVLPRKQTAKAWFRTRAGARG